MTTNDTIRELAAPTRDDALDQIGLDVFLAAVESTRPYVLSRLSHAGLLGELDEAMQRIRVAAWDSAPRYRTEIGGFGSFVQGIARVIVLDEIRLSCRRATQLPDWYDAPSPINDALEDLSRDDELERWRALLRTTLGEHDYRLALNLAAPRTSNDLLAEFGLSPRALRSARERILAEVATVRNALKEADNGTLPTPEVLNRCVPEDFRLRDIARLVGSPLHKAPEIARQCGIRESEVRRRLPQARRLLSIAHQVMSTEVP